MKFPAHKSYVVSKIVAKISRDWQRDVAEYVHFLVDVALVAIGHIATDPREVIEHVYAKCSMLAKRESL